MILAHHRTFQGHPDDPPFMYAHVNTHRWVESMRTTKVRKMRVGKSDLNRSAKAKELTLRRKRESATQIPDRSMRWLCHLGVG